MVQECYDWVWKLTGYLIFMTAVLQLVPGEKDRKYIHFFTGLVLIILIASPVIKFFTSDDLFVHRASVVFHLTYNHVLFL